MTKPGKTTKKKVAAPPLGKAAPAKAQKNPLFEKRARNFRIGGDIQPKRNVSRFVKWPKYIRLQRHKRIIQQRCKVPPAIAQFATTADKAQTRQFERLAKKLKPESKSDKKIRLKAMAAAKAAGAEYKTSAPTFLKYGVNHVCQLVEDGKAKMVAIAHDVDPIELVVWLPALCRKKNIPYVIVKGKALLGQLVGKKTATCVAITNVKKEDQNDLNTLCENFKAQFNENKEIYRSWGGGIMGVKSRHVQQKRERAIAKEQDKKAGLV